MAKNKQNPGIAIALVGAVVAANAAWGRMANYGETWSEKRRAAELLKVEGWQFFQLCGKYDSEGSHERAFPRFVGEVENMIAGETGEYLAEGLLWLVNLWADCSTGRVPSRDSVVCFTQTRLAGAGSRKCVFRPGTGARPRSARLPAPAR